MNKSALLPLFGLVGQALLGQPTRRALAPDGEFPRPFTSIQGVAELPDGRVLVSNRADTSVQIIDFATGLVHAVGRRGTARGEIAFVSRLFQASPDTTLMLDTHNHVIHVFGPNGQLVRADPMRSNGAILNARGVDADGHFFTVADPIGGRPNVIVRYTIATLQYDTLVGFQMSPNDRTSASGPTGAGFRTTEIPFAVHDDWAAFPDGRVAVVRGNDYHVDFYGPAGAHRSGPPTPFEIIPVTAADKEEVLAPRRAMAAAPHGLVPVTVEPSIWFPTKAPFGEKAVWARPNGELWVEIAHRAADSVRTFDVFDSAGVRRGAVTLPITSTLIGIGAQAVYAIRTSPDGLQFVQRFRSPRAP